MTGSERNAVNTQKIGDRITQIGEEIIANLDGINEARERALAETRKIVRLSANTIRAAHRADYEEARDHLAGARSMLDDLSQALSDYPNIYWSGYVRDAQKEFAEANLTLAILAGDPWPKPADIGVEDAVYLNGLGECSGELRRHALDAMRQGDLNRAENMLAIMNDIYDLLVTVDYPDAVTGGLRRTTDLARGVMERTRGDLTVALQQRTLAGALEQVEEKLDAVLASDNGM